MPASWLVTSPPKQTRTSVASAVNRANRASHGLSVVRVINSKNSIQLDARKYMPPWRLRPQRVWSRRECAPAQPRRLLQFNRKIHLGVAAHVGFLADAGGVAMRLHVIRFQGVFAVGQAGDFEIPVLVGDCKERMIKDADVGEHPRVNIAHKTNRHFRFVEASLAHLVLMG